MQTLTNKCCALALAAIAFFTVAHASAATLSPLPKADRSFDSGMFHVDVYGAGAKNLVFIPGLASGPWAWSEQIAHFSPDYTIYVLTLPGFDGRPFTPQPDLLTAFSTDFWTLLDTQHIARPAVIGHSLGGTLTIALAEQHPDRLRAAIALDGLPVFPALVQSTPAQRLATAQSMAGPIASQTPEQVAAYEVTYMQKVGTIDPDLAKPLALKCANSDPKAIAAWTVADLQSDFRPQLKAATVPILEMMPYAKPNQYTQEQTQAFYEMLLTGAPNAKVVPIPDARHFAMIDQPAEVDAAITQFLASAQ